PRARVPAPLSDSEICQRSKRKNNLCASLVVDRKACVHVRRWHYGFPWLASIECPDGCTLGLLAALLTFIPNVGPVLSAIPPILLAFTVSPRHAFFVVLLFGGVHAMEGLLITPIAERTLVRLPPGLTLSVQLVLAFVAGGLGVALA